MDHRGAGRSSRLQCSAENSGNRVSYADMPKCISELHEQADGHPIAFSTTSAATDIKQYIEHIAPNDEVFLYGGSYGTYWTSRVMQLAPAPIKGYILDGSVYQGDPTFTDWNTRLISSSTILIVICTF